MIKMFLVRGSMAVLLMLTLVSCGQDGSSEQDEPLPPAIGSAILSIPPTTQQTVVWCWAAASEMVLKYYGLPAFPNFFSYQCGVVQAAFIGTQCALNCGFCVTPVRGMSDVDKVISDYGVILNSVGIPSRVLDASLLLRRLSDQEIKREIDAGRPVLIGITPGSPFLIPNTSAHVAVLVGYDFTGPIQTVTINDPFPFGSYPFNPYMTFPLRGVQREPGQYSIPLEDVYSGLAWANTVYKIH